MTAPGATVLEDVLRRERLVLIASLAALIGLAWLWLLLGAGTEMRAVSANGAPHMPGMTDMPHMPGMAGMAGMAHAVMQPAAWTPGYAVTMLAMWWVMMAAMMLPSAAPMLLLFARVNRAERDGGRSYVPTGIFAAGYLAVWGAFGALATAAQWGLQQIGLLDPMMATSSRVLAGAILIGAGIWQLTPVKRMCLQQCRSPFGFLATGWRRGRLGALRMGFSHGAYCLGCCWFLMGLLFVGGVMNLLWIAGIAVFVLVEKVLPIGHRVSRLAGIAAAAWGAVMLIEAAVG
jgi:predicted metal-binding membrane protein